MPANTSHALWHGRNARAMPREPARKALHERTVHAHKQQNGTQLPACHAAAGTPEAMQEQDEAVPAHLSALKRLADVAVEDLLAMAQDEEPGEHAVVLVPPTPSLPAVPAKPMGARLHTRGRCTAAMGSGASKTSLSTVLLVRCCHAGVRYNEAAATASAASEGRGRRRNHGRTTPELAVKLEADGGRTAGNK